MSDDFLLPTNHDNDQPCDYLSDVELYDSLLVFFAAMSLTSDLYLMWMYFVVRTPILRRHPTSKCLKLFSAVFASTVH